MEIIGVFERVYKIQGEKRDRKQVDGKGGKVGSTLQHKGMERSSYHCPGYRDAFFMEH